MNFNKHSFFEGQHAFLGASKYHWINYDEAKITDSYSKFLAVQKGTALHDFAAQCIRLGQKLPKSQKTLNMYVNDAVGFKMIPEQILFYSENCFGTADSIIFRNGLLRIHDLKTGVTPAHMEQLEIYAALFCLEYKTKPSDIEIELRLYQSDDILYHKPTAEDILDRVRNTLCQKGLISYKKGNGNSSGIYRINSFVSHNVTQSGHKADTSVALYA